MAGSVKVSGSGVDQEVRWIAGWQKPFFATLIIFSCLPVAGFCADKPIFESTLWDFGEIDGETHVEHTFIIRNTGSRSLVIEKVVPSCGCTATVPEKNILATGESTGLKVSFNPVGKKGEFEETIQVYTDVSETPFRLKITGIVKEGGEEAIVVKLPPPKISVTPMEINLGTMKAGQKAMYKIIVGNEGHGDLYINNVAAPSERGLPLNKKPIKAGKRVELTSIYLASEKGVISDSLVIKSNDPHNAELKIRITGVVE